MTMRERIEAAIWDARYPGEPMYAPDTSETRAMRSDVSAVADAVLAVMAEPMCASCGEVRSWVAHSDTVLHNFHEYVESGTCTCEHSHRSALCPMHGDELLADVLRAERDALQAERDDLRDTNNAMWNAMQRACNHPERWNEILSEALARYRLPSERET